MGLKRNSQLLQAQPRRGRLPRKHAKGQRGILKSAYEKNVPVFVPAFTDSELGLDYALTNRERSKRKKPLFDSILSSIWNTLPRLC